MNQDQLTAEMKVEKDKIAKIGGETRTLLTKIADLEEAIGNSGQELKPEVADAWAELKAQNDIVDEIVPDAPEVPPAE